ncbi:MAG: HD domain-containing protein [Euzebya sp.]
MSGRVNLDLLDVLPEDVQDKLIASYQQPPRHYHTLQHAANVAQVAASLGADRSCLLASWFHDAVYDPTSGDNEERSAMLLLQLMGDDHDGEEAARLIRITAIHDPPIGDTQGAILCDADLAVLGGTPQAYARYRAAVRREFGHLTSAQWLTGRSAVLRALLSRPRIYRTQPAHDRWEGPARDNLIAELRSLGASAAPLHGPATQT